MLPLPGLTCFRQQGYETDMHSREGMRGRDRRIDCVHGCSVAPILGRLLKGKSRPPTMLGIAPDFEAFGGPAERQCEA